MADPNGPTPDLDFDRATFSTSAEARPPVTTCALCQGAIQRVYFEVNGAVACAACRQREEARLGGPRRPMRLVKAVVFGSIGAALGALLYYAVGALTGYEFSLIAIVVGFLAGGGVRMGSEGRGGWMYQGLAMFLTYAAIVSTLVPGIIKGLMEQGPEAAQTASVDASAQVAPAAAPSGPAAAKTATAGSPAPEAPSLGGFLLALVMFTAILFAAPFLAGAQNIMGIVIIGIGLFQAWTMNKRQPLVVTGPYRVGAGEAPRGAVA